MPTDCDLLRKALRSSSILVCFMSGRLDSGRPLVTGSEYARPNKVGKEFRVELPVRSVSSMRAPGTRETEVEGLVEKGSNYTV